MPRIYRAKLSLRNIAAAREKQAPTSRDIQAWICFTTCKILIISHNIQCRNRPSHRLITSHAKRAHALRQALSHLVIFFLEHVVETK